MATKMPLLRALVTICTLITFTSGSRSMADLLSKISQLELEESEDSMNLWNASIKQEKIFASVELDPCNNEEFARLLVKKLRGPEVRSWTCTRTPLAGGRIAEVFAVTLTTGDKSETVLMKTDRNNAIEVDTVKELDKKGFTHMPKLKAIVAFERRKYIVTEFLPQPWMMLKDFLFLSILGQHNFKKVDMTWEQALKGFRLIVEAVFDLKKTLPDVSHCDLHPGNIMVLGDTSDGRIDEVKLIDFGMARFRSCPAPQFSDLQWLRKIFFLMLADVNPGIYKDVEKWRKVFNEFEQTRELSDEISNEFKTQVEPHDHGGLAATKAAAWDWWKEGRSAKRQFVNDHCKICEAHSQEIAQLFKGKIGAVKTEGGTDDSVGLDYVTELFERLRGDPIDPIDAALMLGLHLGKASMAQADEHKAELDQLISKIRQFLGDELERPISQKIFEAAARIQEITVDDFIAQRE